jgi:lipoprotein-releasing system permease protein
MSLAALFARRYLFSPKSHSVINIISWVSAVAIGVPVAAMVILLSVFNGFEGLVKQMYGEFDPDIAITPAQGKVFDRADVPRERLMAVEGVEEVSYVLEDQVLLSYRGRQKEATLRGVDSMYDAVVPIEAMVESGKWEPVRGEMRQALVGAGVAYNLNLNVQLLEPLEVFVPRRGTFNPLVPVDSYRVGELYPSGVFMLDAETDGRYVIAPIEAARELFDYPEGVSAVMVKTSGDAHRVQAALRGELGDGFRVLTRYEQKASLYTIMTYEKWGIFLIILMVMIIASLAIVGSLVMLVIDKRAELRTLTAMGADVGFLRAIFVREGMLIAGLGAAGGLVLGLAVCWAQQAFGLVRIPARTFLVEAYPVVVRAGDIALIVAAFIAVNWIITKFTVASAIPRSSTRI